jgi:hypothetical protein
MKQFKGDKKELRLKPIWLLVPVLALMFGINGYLTSAPISEYGIWLVSSFVLFVWLLSMMFKDWMTLHPLKSITTRQKQNLIVVVLISIFVYLNPKSVMFWSLLIVLGTDLIVSLIDSFLVHIDFQLKIQDRVLFSWITFKSKFEFLGKSNVSRSQEYKLIIDIFMILSLTILVYFFVLNFIV